MPRNNSFLSSIRTIILFQLLTTIDVVVVVGQYDYVPCYMCGGDPDATISNPNTVIELTGPLGLPPGGISVLPCSIIFDSLLSGMAFNQSTCDLLLTAPDVVMVLQEPCGCSTLLIFPSMPVATSSSSSLSTFIISTSPAVSILIGIILLIVIGFFIIRNNVKKHESNNNTMTTNATNKIGIHTIGKKNEFLVPKIFVATIYVNGMSGTTSSCRYNSVKISLP